jgi:sarcosine/dimethylglycine N-methyltransferase
MSLDQQYATGLSRDRIGEALVAAGLDLGDLQRSDLAPLEDFHTMGRIATSQLAELAEIERSDEVLDAGSGVGGTARYLAGQFGCWVTTVDLTEEYCDASRWLNQLVGLDGSISVHHGDVTDLPFPSASFTVVMSQHVQMNVADKTLLYDEARRVLRPRGRLAIWDITAGAGRARLPPSVG